MASMTNSLRTIAILRDFTPDQAREWATAAWSIGIDLVEVPVQSEEAWDTLGAISELPHRGALGAGTVLDAQDVERAAATGCSVIISPGLDKRVVAATRKAELKPLPGVLSSTEISQAVRLGLEAVKLFPAQIGGAELVRALRGPFPNVRFIAVGGVTHENAPDFLRAGATGVAFGSSLGRLLAQPSPRELVAELHELALMAEAPASYGAMD